MNINQTVLIVGLGLIGKQRLDACLKFGIKPENVYVLDANITDSEFVNESSYTEINFTRDLETIFSKKFDWAVVSVPHNFAGELVISLLDKGTKVLMEKPLGRNIVEAEKIAEHFNAEKLSIGFNYRFMPGIIKLKSYLDDSLLGDISTVSMELGHGGSPQDKTSWKLDPLAAGGGVLLDPGIHLIDLLVYLFQADDHNLVLEGRTSWQGFWNTGIEESSSLVGYVGTIPFSITTSIVAWRTRFKIEVIGTEKYFEIEGRGRSEGPQITTAGDKWGWLSATSQRHSETQSQVANSDNSLIDETFAWLSDFDTVCKIDQALIGMKIYDKILRLSNDN